MVHYIHTLIQRLNTYRLHLQSFPYLICFYYFIVIQITLLIHITHNRRKQNNGKGRGWHIIRCCVAKKIQYCGCLLTKRDRTLSDRRTFNRQCVQRKCQLDRDTGKCAYFQKRYYTFFFAAWRYYWIDAKDISIQ